MIEIGKRGALYELRAEGYGEPLYVTSLASSCGRIAEGDGVSFRFGEGGGTWVVALADLRELVARADAERAAHARLVGSILSAIGRP